MEVCAVLAQRDPERFESLPANRHLRSSTGRPNFSAAPGPLRDGEQIAGGVYAEVNHKVSYLCELLRKLLDEFGLPRDERKLHLRQDRGAEAGP